jgi:RTX calcium-binding nonapeptide repeat (4 copies)
MRRPIVLLIALVALRAAVVVPALARDGGPGPDRLAGADSMLGGYGKDRLRGGAADDRLEPGYGDRGEIVNCGPGRDTAVLGPGDTAIGCEVRRQAGRRSGPTPERAAPARARRAAPGAPSRRRP